MQFLARRQRGLSITGWIFVIAVALFFALLGMKMIPSYLQYYSIVQVLESIAQDPTLKQAPPGELRKIFNRRIDINGVYDFPKKGLKIDRSQGEGTMMIVDYEVREPMAGNVDVVMHFHKEVKVK
ncbi:MAG: DUF4845 domain-containing protein [Gammaproteobacteria bacterium]|nr:MAG: DUF4845 domain-containing protein [Gammaproteobacteria bacterium]RTZ72810.1 MAG: DUF4845 domain-containing protein [Gammaproteobacteria bacterium]